MNLSQKFKLGVTLGAIVFFIVMLISLATADKEEVIEEQEIVVCPDVLFNEYGTGCIEHINDRYPGKLTASGDSQLMPELEEKTSHDRFKELCYKYGLNPSEIWEVENKYGIREAVILGIVISETSGGKNGNYVSEGCYNIGNIGNNDRGDRRCYATKRESLEAIGRTLSNQYLGDTQTLGCLSKAGSCKWWEDKGHVYASSNGNRERTMLNVLNAIYGEELGEIDPERFNVRRQFTIYQ